MTKENKLTHTWGIAGLVFGIIGLILLLILPVIAILFSILAIVFSLIQRHYKPTGIATAGLILGIIGIILYLIIGSAFFGGPHYESGTGSVNVDNT